MTGNFTILGIESSCDETAAALLQVARNNSQVTNKSQILNFNIQILSNVVASQVEIHQKYGGIVPEVAARHHVENIIPVIEEALGGKKQTNFKSQITNIKPDLIAVTQGPGLITSLQVGIQTAKTLSYSWNVPMVGINHLEAHLWSYLLSKNQETRNKKITNSKLQIQINQTPFPAVGLIISGGHTELILVKGIGKYKLIGRTRDDAAGEAFDKTAKLMNLGYPGGPIISHFAGEGNPTAIQFPRPMLDSDNFDFSFSGIKTSVKYYLNSLVPKGHLSQRMINDICASFQAAVVDILVQKTIKAAVKYKAKSVILGGGVSANKALITSFKKQIGNSNSGLANCAFFHPEIKFTGDNAAMIALAGYFNLKKAESANWQKLTADANLQIV